ncbi:MAG: thioredoxin family protein [Actinomycetota bacterium]
MPGDRTSAGRLGLVVLALVAFWVLLPAKVVAADDTWHHTEDGETVVEFYFVYSSTCPHCQEAMPFIEEMQDARPWLNVWWLQADSGDPQVAETAMAVATELGEDITGVPTFMFCDRMIVGYDNEYGVGADLAAQVDACHEQYAADSPQVTTTTVAAAEVEVPGVGVVSASAVPLPVFTAIVAGLDAFNPCAFFVLLFLLSLLVHTRSRTRMAIVGATFVVISGVLYFVFMAAWLNLFLVTGHLAWISFAAGSVAIAVAVLNLKDYAKPGTGASLSIPETAKPGLFKRMRGLVAGERFLPVLGATVALAIVANSYELLCTAGLPMVFTRVLTLNGLSTPSYYGYLVLYNVIYVIPLLMIVTAFVWKLGSRKLQPEEGRTLKLLSGLMMLGLGGVLLIAPELLEQIGIAIGILVAAVAITLIVTLANRWRQREISEH